eukprot:1195600-Prorocentrum_minimum.AAC.1
MKPCQQTKTPLWVRSRPLDSPESEFNVRKSQDDGLRLEPCAISGGGCLTTPKHRFDINIGLIRVEKETPSTESQGQRSRCQTVESPMMRGKRLVPMIALVGALACTVAFSLWGVGITRALRLHNDEAITILTEIQERLLVIETQTGRINAVTDGVKAKDLNNPDVSQKFQDLYSVYHQSRKDNCDGCRYIPFYDVLWGGYHSVFDAGAANCGVMRMLKARGKFVRGIEFNQWIVDNYCTDLSTSGEVEIGPLHLTSETTVYDLVLCTDVLEHVPLENIEQSVATLARLTKPGGHLFFVIAHDPSKHENHADRSKVAQAGINDDIKVHETVKPRSWWLETIRRHGLEEDQTAWKKFQAYNEREVKDPRYGYTSAKGKYYPPNERHMQRLYFLFKSPAGSGAGPY